MPNKNERTDDFALYFSEINVAGKTMCVGSQPDRQTTLIF